MTLQSYVKFWKKAFQYSGKTNRKLFWGTTIINMIILGILMIMLVTSIEELEYVSDMERLKMIIIILLPHLFAIPQIALTYRRFNDVHANKLTIWICAISLFSILPSMFIFGDVFFIFAFCVYLLTALINSIIASLPSK